ncbi:MAG: hypothetical protein ACRET1_10130, partial [Burkholderiales bacterium]
ALPAESSNFRRLCKGVGVIALVAGVALVIGVLAGGRDVLQPLAGLRSVAARAGPGPYPAATGYVAPSDAVGRAATVPHGVSS